MQFVRSVKSGCAAIACFSCALWRPALCRRDATNLTGIPDNHYDLVLSSHMLEHLPDPLRAVFELRRVLKPGGQLLLVLPWREATFDQHRPADFMQHLMRDYVSAASPDGRGAETVGHLEQTVRAMDYERDPSAGGPALMRQRALISASNVHHHVFDFDLIVQVLECASMRLDMLDLLEPWHQVAIATKTEEAAPR